MNFLHKCLETAQISNFMKFRPVGVELFHVDGQKARQVSSDADLTKLVVAIRNFANAPKYQWLNISQGREQSLFVVRIMRNKRTQFAKILCVY
jgi:hypothetical protein